MRVASMQGASSTHYTLSARIFVPERAEINRSRIGLRRKINYTARPAVRRCTSMYCLDVIETKLRWLHFSTAGAYVNEADQEQDAGKPDEHVNPVRHAHAELDLHARRACRHLA